MQNLTILALAIPEIIGGLKIQSGHVTLTTPRLKGDLSYLCWHLTRPTCVQNLLTVA